MASTKIQWATKTWNPQKGCWKRSAGCDHCYAERVSINFRTRNVKGYERVTDQYGWTGELETNPEWLKEPAKWKSSQIVFVGSMTDLFAPNHDREYTKQIWQVMAACPHHIFLVLTKNTYNMQEFAHWMGADEFALENVWIGCSIENQEKAEERLEELINTPAAHRWVNVGPMLGPVTFKIKQRFGIQVDYLAGIKNTSDGIQMLPGRIEWVCSEYESGRGSRQIDPQHLYDLCDEVKACPEPTRFNFKQWGTWVPVEKEQQDGKVRWAYQVWSDENEQIEKRYIKKGNVVKQHFSGRYSGYVGKHGSNIVRGRQWDEYPKVMLDWIQNTGEQEL
jgi:protein gp37